MSEELIPTIPFLFPHYSCKLMDVLVLQSETLVKRVW